MVWYDSKIGSPRSTVVLPSWLAGEKLKGLGSCADSCSDRWFESNPDSTRSSSGISAAGGRLRVLRFHRLYTEGPGCSAPMGSMRFAAFGTEPFWAAIDAGDALRLERPGAEPLVAQPRTMREEGGSWIVEGETGSGLLSLRLTPGFCSDGMSDSLYAWTALVQTPAGELKGCGFRGSEAEQK